MPVFNKGIVPGGAIGTELSYVTRRAFVPELIVQIYKATPTLSLFLRNSQRASGGLSQVTVPVQGSSFVNFSWTDYSGTFPQPAVQTAVTNAEFNLDMGVVPVPLLGAEAMIQDTEAVIPLLKARMADAKTVAVQGISTAIFSNNSGSANILNGLPEAYDNGTNVAFYGGINRNTNTFWQGQYYGSAGAVLTRSTFIKYITQATLNAGGETPDFGIMSYSDWTTLLTDYMSVEQFNTTPGSVYGEDEHVNAGFRAITLGNVPLYPDPFCPKGTAYLGNSKYIALYLSENASFDFSGFYSTIPNLQIGSVGLLVVAMNLVCVKPSSGAIITGITGGAY
jgi:uncharacterized Zn-binding protein involved in type VI secretion